MPPCQGGCREFEPRLPLIKNTHRKMSVFYQLDDSGETCFLASCVSELRLEQFCDWTKSKKQNAELPLNASEQDTSLVSRSKISRWTLVPSAYFVRQILARTRPLRVRRICGRTRGKCIYISSNATSLTTSGQREYRVCQNRRCILMSSLLGSKK